MTRIGWTVVALTLALAGCDGGDGGDDAAVGRDAGGGDVDAGGGGVDAGGGGGVDAGGGGGVDAGGGDVDAGGGAIECDYRTIDGRVVIEAENLPLTEDWRVASADAGFTGSGYIEWTGSSHNSDPSFGQMSVRLHLDAAGRYRLQWHTRVGMGTNATEHNDTWVRVADADGFFGTQGSLDAEDRVYPRPTCDDTAFMDSIRAMSTVAAAGCPNGSTRDGWFKVYSSGALDWRWSARTSDNDAHDVIIEVDAPRVVTLELAARADFSQLDRIVIHLESQPDSEVRDLGLAETPCP